jgi:lipopolysaccharide export system permease protein
MAKDILSQRVPFHLVALLMLYSLPSVIALAAPFASLTGTLMTIGRLTSDNEILVFLSSGLSYRNIVFPALVVGILISIGSFLSNDILLPAGTVQFTRLYRRIMISSPALELQANSVKRFKDTLIVTGPVSGGTIDDLLIMDRTTDGERRIILAKKASLKDSGKGNISLELEDTFMQSIKENSREDYDYARSSLLSYTIPQEDIAQGVFFATPNQMSSVDVRREIRKKEEALRENIDNEYRRFIVGALGLESVLRAGGDGKDWNRVKELSADLSGKKDTISFMKSDRSLSMYRLEFYKKFSIPFGALSFVFLAVSLGLLARKSGQTVGFIFGISIAVVYWALLLGGQTMGVRLGYSPFWSMWLPNMLAGGIGIIMCFVRLRR